MENGLYSAEFSEYKPFLENMSLRNDFLRRFLPVSYFLCEKTAPHFGQAFYTLARGERPASRSGELYTESSSLSSSSEAEGGAGTVTSRAPS